MSERVGSTRISVRGQARLEKALGEEFATDLELVEESPSKKRGRGSTRSAGGVSVVDFTKLRLKWPTASQDFRLPLSSGLSLGIWLDNDVENAETFSLPPEFISSSIKRYEVPPPFRKLKQNLYYDQSVRNQFILPASECPTCSCVAPYGCGFDCINYRLFQECRIGECDSVRGAVDDDGNPMSCGNTCIQERTFPPTEVFRTEEGRGFGLRLAKDTVTVPAGTLMQEYLGEVITLDECKKRLMFLGDEDYGCDFYFASLSAQLILDAKPMGSDARFANHSCSPNCQLQKWSVMGEPRVVLAALVDISPGTELTYNYHADTLDGLVARQPCLCGAQNCSGFIGGKVEKEKVSWGDRAISKILSQKVPRLTDARDLLHEIQHEKKIHADIHSIKDANSIYNFERECVEKIVSEGEAWILRKKDLIENARYKHVDACMVKSESACADVSTDNGIHVHTSSTDSMNMHVDTCASTGAHTSMNAHVDVHMNVDTCMNTKVISTHTSDVHTSEMHASDVHMHVDTCTHTDTRASECTNDVQASQMHVSSTHTHDTHANMNNTSNSDTHVTSMHTVGIHIHEGEKESTCVSMSTCSIESTNMDVPIHVDIQPTHTHSHISTDIIVKSEETMQKPSIDIHTHTHTYVDMSEYGGISVSELQELCDACPDIHIEDALLTKRVLARANIIRACIAQIPIQNTHNSIHTHENTAYGCYAPTSKTEGVCTQENVSTDVHVHVDEKGKQLIYITPSQLFNALKELQKMEFKGIIVEDGHRLMELVTLLDEWAKKACSVLRLKIPKHGTKEHTSVAGRWCKVKSSCTAIDVLELKLREIVGYTSVREECEQNVKSKISNIANTAAVIESPEVGRRSGRHEEKHRIKAIVNEIELKEKEKALKEAQKAQKKVEKKSTLHCLCLLPESVKSCVVTLMQCEGYCKKWYHPPCVNAQIKGSLESVNVTYICPMCMHATGCPSELSLSPSSQFFRTRGNRPLIIDLENLATQASHLPIRTFEPQYALEIVTDIVSGFAKRAQKLCAEADMYMKEGGGGRTHRRKLEVLENDPQNVPEKVLEIVFEEEDIFKNAWYDGMFLESVNRDLAYETRLIERMGNVICEGALVEVVDITNIDNMLRLRIWRLVASLAHASTLHLLSDVHRNKISEEDERMFVERTVFGKLYGTEESSLPSQELSEELSKELPSEDLSKEAPSKELSSKELSSEELSKELPSEELSKELSGEPSEELSSKELSGEPSEELSSTPVKAKGNVRGKKRRGPAPKARSSKKVPVPEEPSSKSWRPALSMIWGLLQEGQRLEVQRKPECLDLWNALMEFAVSSSALLTHLERCKFTTCNTHIHDVHTLASYVKIEGEYGYVRALVCEARHALELKKLETSTSTHVEELSAGVLEGTEPSLELLPCEETSAVTEESSLLPAESSSSVVEGSSSVSAEDSSIPTETSSVPAENSLVPAETSLVPLEISAVMESSAHPAESSSVPTESSLVPAESFLVSAESSSAPEENSAVPAESSSHSAESSFVPEENSAAPVPERAYGTRNAPWQPKTKKQTRPRAPKKPSISTPVISNSMLVTDTRMISTVCVCDLPISISQAKCVFCSVCSARFHAKCVGVRLKDVKTLRQTCTYVCIGCAEHAHTRYMHGWPGCKDIPKWARTRVEKYVHTLTQRDRALENASTDIISAEESSANKRKFCEEGTFYAEKSQCVDNGGGGGGVVDLSWKNDPSSSFQDLSSFNKMNYNPSLIQPIVPGVVLSSVSSWKPGPGPVFSASGVFRTSPPSKLSEIKKKNSFCYTNDQQIDNGMHVDSQFGSVSATSSSVPGTLLHVEHPPVSKFTTYANTSMHNNSMNVDANFNSVAGMSPSEQTHVSEYTAYTNTSMHTNGVSNHGVVHENIEGGRGTHMHVNAHTHASAYDTNTSMHMNNVSQPSIVHDNIVGGRGTHTHTSMYAHAQTPAYHTDTSTSDYNMQGLARNHLPTSNFNNGGGGTFLAGNGWKVGVTPVERSPVPGTFSERSSVPGSFSGNAPLLHPSTTVSASTFLGLDPGTFFRDQITVPAPTTSTSTSNDGPDPGKFSGKIPAERTIQVPPTSTPSLFANVTAVTHRHGTRGASGKSQPKKYDQYK